MLRLAPPQDIVLTQRRDEAYKQQLGQALQESAEEFLGGQHATNLEPEVNSIDLHFLLLLLCYVHLRIPCFNADVGCG